MQYLVSVIDDGQAAAARRPDSATEAERVAIDAFNERLRAEGSWVYAGGMGTPDAATLIDGRGSETVVTDGPFVQTKEFIAGFWVIEATDPEAALDLAAEASRACNRKVEVRPLLHP